MFPYGVVDVKDLPEKFQPPGGAPVEETQQSDDDYTKFDPHLVSSEPSVGGARLPREGIDLKEHISSLECSLIKQALDDAGGVVAHAAKRLKMRRTTLVEKLRKYGLQRSESVSEI
jgi:sigma-54 specific flagellar transcriptional regulator A